MLCWQKHMCVNNSSRVSPLTVSLAYYLQWTQKSVFFCLSLLLRTWLETFALTVLNSDCFYSPVSPCLSQGFLLSLVNMGWPAGWAVVGKRQWEIGKATLAISSTLSVRASPFLCQHRQVSRFLSRAKHGEVNVNRNTTNNQFSSTG